MANSSITSDGIIDLGNDTFLDADELGEVVESTSSRAKGRKYDKVISVNILVEARAYVNNKTCLCKESACIFCNHEWKFIKHTEPKIGSKYW